MTKLFADGLFGEITAPPSKSFLHRYLILAALSDKKTKIICKNPSDDVLATVECLRCLGAEISVFDNEILVIPKPFLKKALLNCANSASTLRFLMPVCAALGIDAEFTLGDTLKKRPHAVFCEEMRKCGVKCSFDGEKIYISGKISQNTICLSSSVSSQLISGFLMAMPVLSDNFEIIIDEKPSSRQYIEMTKGAILEFGAEIVEKSNVFSARGKYTSPEKILCEGDFSSAAFYLVGGVISGKIRILGLNEKSLQSDAKIIDIIKSANGKIYYENGACVVGKSEISPICIDIDEYPDLFPILCILAAYAKGESLLYNAKRLKYKESDRLFASHEMLKNLGVDAEIFDDSLKIFGKGELLGGKINAYSDHRIAMSAFIASAISERGVEIDDTSCINKSYPDFLKHFSALGGKIDV